MEEDMGDDAKGEPVELEDVEIQETGFETNRGLVDNDAIHLDEQDRLFAKYREKMTVDELHNNTKKTKNIARFGKKMMDKPTKQYLDAEYQKKIDPGAWKETIDGLHPRKFGDGSNVASLKPIGCCERVGYLTSSQKERNCFEYNNKQVAMYFKLLKCLFPLFVIIGAFSCILLTFY